MSSARGGRCGRRLGGRASCSRISQTEEMPRGEPRSRPPPPPAGAPASRVPLPAAACARQARCPALPARCCCHDALYDLCHSPRTMQRDPSFGRFLPWLLCQPSSLPPTPETQLGRNPWQFLAADRATKVLSNCYNIQQILFELLQSVHKTGPALTSLSISKGQNL